MPTRDQIVTALRLAPTVVRRRLKEGPEQPGWSPIYEVLIEMAKRRDEGGADLTRRRATMDDFGLDELGRKRARFETVTAGGRPALWTVPTLGHDDAVVLYLHGGAYCLGSPQSHRSMTAGLAEAGLLRVLALDYRLAPEHACPAAIEDAVAAFDWLVEQGVPPERIVVAGDSAGGGLSLCTLVALRDRAGAVPAGGVLISPWLDLANVDPSTNNESDFIVRNGLATDAEAYAGGLPLEDPRVSPIHADLEGLPPLFTIAGGAETLLTDSVALEAKADKLGIDHTLFIEPGEVHVYPLFDGYNPRAKIAHRRMALWIREQLGRHRAA